MKGMLTRMLVALVLLISVCVPGARAAPITG